MRVWETKMLGDLIQIKHGYGFKSQYFTDTGSHILLTPGNFYDEGGFKHTSKPKCYVGPIPEGFIHRHNDLIVAMTEQAEGLLGSTALVPKGNRYLHNQRLGLISIIDESRIDKQFLYRLFNTPVVRLQIQASANGTKVRHTSPSRIYHVKINLPTLAEQQKIAAILSAYDDLIENNNKRIALLESAAEEIYREWFVRLRFPGHEDVVFRKGVPEGWETIQLDQFCDRVTDGTHDTPKPTTEGYHLITGKNIKNGIINFDNAYKISETDHLKIKQRSGLSPGDILFSNIGTLGSTAIVTDDTEYSVKNVLIFKPRNQYHSVFLYYMLMQEQVLEQLLMHSSGASQQFISLRVARQFKIYVPRLTTIELFGQNVLPIQKQKEQLVNINDKLKKSRDLLLPRLISGKLSVDELDIHLPPSMKPTQKPAHA